ncbi:hypothetical protein EBZ39_19295, partial [bacterium]|nr:hypothetical protein [bacterium]
MLTYLILPAVLLYGSAVSASSTVRSTGDTHPPVQLDQATYGSLKSLAEALDNQESDEAQELRLLLDKAAKEAQLDEALYTQALQGMHPATPRASQATLVIG